jgi:NADH:ubiquinone oxidoreductase subunit K
LNLNWLDFFIFIFWFSVLCFIFNCYDILIIILYSEIIWVVLYCCIVVLGIINDDLILISTSFFIMALAGLEFCIGFILSIFFRNFKKTFNIDEKNSKGNLSLNYI